MSSNINIEMAPIGPNPSLHGSLQQFDNGSPLLSDEQVAFLKRYFINYDPLSRSYNLDFSKVKSNRVILMGECSQSLLMQRLQNKFLTLFVASPTRLLLNELSSACEISNERLPYWKHLPQHLRLFGSDVNGCNETEFLKNVSTQHTNNQARITKLHALRMLYKNISYLFDRELAQRTITLEKDHICLTNDLLTQVHELFKKYNQENLEATPPKQASDICKHHFCLSEQIKKHLMVTHKVMAFCGMLQFFDEQLVDQLQRQQISYSVLMPNAYLIGLIENEFLGVYKHAAVRLLELRTKDDRVDCTVPIHLTALFSTAIQQKLKSELSKPVQNNHPIQIEALAARIRKKGRWTMPANTRFLLKDMDGSDFLALVDLLGQSPVDKQKSISMLTSVINKKLLFLNLTVLKVNIAGNILLEKHFLPKTLETGVIFSSDQPFQWIVGADRLSTTATYFLREMKRRGMKTFQLPPEQSLFFSDITEEERQKMGQDNYFKEWLAQKAPFNRRVNCLGEGLVVQPLDLTVDAEQVNGISLVSQQGLLFELTDK